MKSEGLRLSFETATPVKEEAMASATPVKKEAHPIYHPS